jgi:copper chaperone NosL
VKNALEGFMKFCSQPLSLKARPVLALLAVALGLSFTAPLWHVRMVAPQYPQGLDLYVSSYKVDGGHEGRDVHEINTLNHYIGMRPIDRAGMKDLDWLPFAFGLLVLLTLRVAAIGDVRSLIDLAVVTIYVSGFALARFVLQLWSFGHDLNPEAPFHMEPFMPVIIGHKQIANFTTEAWPGWGSAFISVFGLGVLALTAWQLWSGRVALRRST